MLNARGQILLLAIALFTATLLFILSSMNKPTPKLTKYVGELQSSIILQISREYVSDTSMGRYLDLEGLINDLYDYNVSHGIFIGRLSYLYSNYTDLDVNNGYGNYTLTWNVSYPYLENKVRFSFYWNYSFLNYYYRNIEGIVVKYSNYSLYVEHTYICPQFKVIIHPCIYAVEKKVVDIKYVGNGVWIIGIPTNTIQKFVDEYEIKFKVKG